MNVTMTMEEFEQAKEKAALATGKAVAEDLSTIFVDTMLKAASAFLPEGKFISIHEHGLTSDKCNDGFGDEQEGSCDPDFSDAGSCSRGFNKTLN